ncbi:hypothetical protein C8R46DRAFT_1027667 [Mycena filopes]|nr:hypothetical protein C8R46DRAFT_1027667 [Mycena filopes]
MSAAVMASLIMWLISPVLGDTLRYIILALVSLLLFALALDCQTPSHKLLILDRAIKGRVLEESDRVGGVLEESLESLEESERFLKHSSNSIRFLKHSALARIKVSLTTLIARSNMRSLWDGVWQSSASANSRRETRARIM